MPRIERFLPGTNVGDWSTKRSFGTPGWYSDAPTVATPTEGDQQIAISWSAGNTNGLAVTGWKIEQHDDSSWSTLVSSQAAGTTTYTATGLTNGTNYKYRVTALVALGDGADPDGDSVSADSAVKVPRGVPSAPGTLSLADGSPNHSAINLSWSAPSSDNGASVTSYKIERSTDGASWSDVVASTGNTNTTYSNTGLDGDTEYHYRVSAINAAGTGAVSNAPTHTTADPNPSISTTGSPTIRTYTISGTNYKSYTYTASGTFNVTANPNSSTFDILVVAGGGGGGGYSDSRGGGGGAGGFRTTTSTGSGDTTVTVGAGGGVTSSWGYEGGTGSDSSIANGIAGSGTTYTSKGGGHGSGPSTNGGAGGSGGGGGDASAWGSTAGGTRTASPVQGYDGGDSQGNGGYHYGGGGGGGAYGEGRDQLGSENSPSTDAGGNSFSQTLASAHGGRGLFSNYADGTTDTHPPSAASAGIRSFAGGGGGSCVTYLGFIGGGVGGLYSQLVSNSFTQSGMFRATATTYVNNGAVAMYGAGSGSGNGSTGHNSAATANSGSGGGSQCSGTSRVSGAGGSGIVVIRYAVV